MWLQLDLEGIDFRFRIKNYQKSVLEGWEEQWCDVDLSLRGGKWLNYQTSSELLLACEVEALRDRISDLLEDKITATKELEFIEPDLTLVLHPKRDRREDPKCTYVAPGYEIADIYAEFQVHFWNGALTENYLSLCFCRDDLEYFLTYLRLITHEIPKDDPTVRTLLAAGMIRRI